MGGSQSYRRRSGRYGYTDHPGSMPMGPEDMFSGYYSSYPVTPTSPISPVSLMEADPYFQYPGFPGAMRRVNSDPHLAGYDPYMQYGMAQGGYDLYNPYAAQGAYGYPQHQEAPAMRPQWGSLPNLYDQAYVDLARNPQGRPFLQKLFGQNSVAQRRNILKKLDQRQMDPFQKTAQWLMNSDQRRVR